MLTRVNSCAILGLDGRLITIEVDVSRGFPQLVIVGLPDKAVDESRQRIPTAIRNAGFEYPFSKKIVVNLAPADLKKEGASFDVPIAVGVLVASGQLDCSLEDAVFVGELALDGKLRPTRGALPVAIWARENHYKTLFVPYDNAHEAALVDEIKVIPVRGLADLAAHLSKKQLIGPHRVMRAKTVESHDEAVDMAYISGQEHAKRALEIAASGGHNIALCGPPGSGKTLLARSLVSILPQMDISEQLEVTKIYSIAGRLDSKTPLVTSRPFRTPHHTSSGVALVGGGTFPKPGEISLAHRGVLFLDEFPEFSRQVLENLRQPLEDGVITVSRAQGSVAFPARFMLVASQNPCPCGYADDPARECVCSQAQIIKYRNKISGPIMDRIDLHVEVPRVPFEKLAQQEGAEPSVAIRERVNRARRIQHKRLAQFRILTNSEMNAEQLKKLCPITPGVHDLLKQAVATLHLSARSFHRILKIARTIADLSGSESVDAAHVAEALQYRPRLD